MTVHRFRESNDVSREYANAPWWFEVYSQAFPTFQGMVNVRDDGLGQRNGIDRHIVLGNGRTITVDEKVRRPNKKTGREYNDFFLEYLSDDKRKTPGWVAKDLACDFIAYAFVRSGRCYLLPFPLLRRAWRLFGPEWVKQFPKYPAENEGYMTWGCCVPIDVVRSALAGSMLVTFTPAIEEAA